MTNFSTESASRIAFVLSLVIFAFLYGYGAHVFGWFPADVMERAGKQAGALLPISRPIYVHDRTYDRAGARSTAPEEMQPGLTVVTSAWMQEDRLTPGLRLIDREGAVVHEWRVDPAELFPESPTARRSLRNLDIQGSRLLSNGDVVVNVEYAGTLRLDACGEVLWRLLEGSHHSIARAEDGSFWIPGVRSEPGTATPAYPDGFPGIRTPVYRDMILRLGGEGAVLDSIHVLDVLADNDLLDQFVKTRAQRPQDPTHLNDVDPLPRSIAKEYPMFEAGDLAVSLRNLDLVFVLDPESRRVKWHATEPFVMQHDPDFLGGGWIGIFDNRRDGTLRGTMLGGSRIVALQPHTDSMRVLFPGPDSEPFYTHHRGKWQRLENGNLLLVESAAGRVVEVGPAGGTVWEWVAEPYEDSGVSSVTGAARVDVTREDVASWPCAEAPAAGAGEAR